jgi:predicted mannosyl-3-phosphoglycerate phosphatase (HAD superfamily)
MIIAIDFDGTIVEHKYPEIGELLPNAKEVINELYDLGYTIIIWTCRSNQNSSSDDLEKMVLFLKENGIKFNYVNKNEPFIWGCKPKIYADIYIDDRGVFWEPDWLKIRKRILEGCVC